MWDYLSDKERLDKVEKDVEQLKDRVSLLTNYVANSNIANNEVSRSSNTQSNNDFDSSAYLGVYELAEFCKVAQQTIYNWIYKKKIPYIKMNGRILFSKEEVKIFMRERAFKKGQN